MQRIRPRRLSLSSLRALLSVALALAALVLALCRCYALADGAYS